MHLFNLLLILTVYIINSLSFQNPPQTFSVKAELYDQDQDQPQTLGLSQLSGAETVTICKDSDMTDKYVNGAVLFPFKGYLCAQWQSSAVKTLNLPVFPLKS